MPRSLLLSFFALATLASAQPAYDLLLKGGHVIDPKNNRNGVMDVAVAGGKVAKVAPSINPSEARRTVDVKGLYVSPGFIDLHVHVYLTSTPDGMSASVQPDAFSFRSGTTTMVDAGSAGAKTFAEFRRNIIDKSRTRVLALLNIAASGMGTGKEDDLAGLDVDAAVRTANQHKDVIVGFKSAHFGGPGWESIDAAVKASKATKMPVMVDFGYLNKVRSLRTLLEDKLQAGDIYTHCYSGHREEILENGQINPAMVNGRKRGIFFDVGFGAGSFYWYVALPLTQQGFWPDSISTDLHTGSMNGGMKDMANTASTILSMGAPLAKVIEMSTWTPAKEIKRTDLGHLDVGAEADITVLRVDTGKFGFIDSAGAGHEGTKAIVPEITLRKGRVVWDRNARAAENWKTFQYKKRRWEK
ncbi:MAG: amidohydrolase/deacetylase family metallohydrolase [Bryobacterales bacterium]|nr:amidohydrolase/deacetylase family metallohydrolase [Bryobacterales bacterium]